MNTHLLHPDTFYELNRLYQQERLEKSRQQRPFLEPTGNGRSLKDRTLLISGDLFITLGKNLKRRAAQPRCNPQVV